MSGRQRAARAAAVLGLAAGMILGVGRAGGWSSPEHAAQSNQGYSIACSVIDCPASWTDYGVSNDTLRAMYSQFAQTPDACHSFWHSDVAAEHFTCVPRTTEYAGDAYGGIEPYCATGQCNIFAGVSDGTDPASGNPKFTAQQMYVLRTNENHFGASAQDHWQHWSALASTAAERARDTCNPVCAKLAVGLQGFADHYIEDRTASGHAWNHHTYGFAYGAANPHHFQDNTRGCIHGSQGLLGRLGLGCFAIHGLGDQPRQFGDAFWGPGGWTNDDGWGTASTAQHVETVGGDRDAIGHVLSTLACESRDASWREAYVSNLELCKVTIEQCCEWTGDDDGYDCGVCDGNSGLATHAKVLAACPIVVGEIPGVPSWRKAIITRGPDWWNGDVTLMPPPGGWSGTNAARTLFAGARGIHPDAAWDASHDILAQAGCTPDVRMCGDPLRDTACDEWPCDLDKVVYCGGTLPADPCGGCARYYKYTELLPEEYGVGRCGCKTEEGDGICALGTESVANSSDCGPKYCGDGYCDEDGAEDQFTCPGDCAGALVTTTQCGGDTMPVCSPERGPLHQQVDPTCGNSQAEPGEHCSTCPQDVWSGTAYPGTAACSEEDPQYARKHYTGDSCWEGCCVPASCGGWCPGFCDGLEGCVPSGEPTSCPGETEPSCNQQRAACGWEPIPGGDNPPPPDPPPDPPWEVCGDLCSSEGNPDDSLRQQLRCGAGACEDFDCSDACCFDWDGTTTRKRDCTSNWCDASGGGNGTCESANLCCDDCDPCNGQEYWDAESESCETTPPPDPRPIEWCCESPRCESGMCGDYWGGCGEDDRYGTSDDAELHCSCGDAGVDAPSDGGGGDGGGCGYGGSGCDGGGDGGGGDGGGCGYGGSGCDGGGDGGGGDGGGGDGGGGDGGGDGGGGDGGGGDGGGCGYGGSGYGGCGYGRAAPVGRPLDYNHDGCSTGRPGGELILAALVLALAHLRRRRRRVR